MSEEQKSKKTKKKSSASKSAPKKERSEKRKPSIAPLAQSAFKKLSRATRNAPDKLKDIDEYMQDVNRGERTLLAKWRSPKRIHFTFPGFILLTVIVLCLALLMMDNASISVEKVTVSVVGLNKDLEGYTILQLSDLHGRRFGAQQNSLLKTINAQNYNLILMSGDMVGKKGDPEPLYEILDGLKSKKPVYFIAGDSDPNPLLSEIRDTPGTLEERVLSDWVLGAEARGATYLDAPEHIKVGSGSIYLTPEYQLSLNISDHMRTLTEQRTMEEQAVISGEDDGRSTLPFTEYRLGLITQLQETANAMTAEDVHIALAHYPPTVDYINTTQQLNVSGDQSYLRPVDLALAGHYCGGVWRLPFLGALYIPAEQAPRHGWFPDQGSVMGLSSLGGTNLYISPGLGATDDIWLPKFRLFNSPTITLITLTSALNTGSLNG